MTHPLLRRLLRGDPRKQSRFQTFDGRWPPPSAWLYLPHSILSTVRFKLTSHRPVVPWLGYRAIRRIRQLVGPGTRVLELGSGLSTIWFARRGAEVVSIEADAEWYRRLSERLEREQPHRVTLLHYPPPYSDAPFARQEFDFALVDGEARDEAMRVALAAVRPGGHVYLDNADVPEPSHQRALALLLAAGNAEWFVDFIPTAVAVASGVIATRVARPTTCPTSADQPSPRENPHSHSYPGT